MPTYTIYSDAADGEVKSVNADRATSRSSGTLTATTGAATINVGEIGPVVGSITNYAAFLSFDTSGVVETVSAVTLSIYPSADNFTTVLPTLNVRKHDWGTSLTTADWLGSGGIGAKTLVATMAATAFTTGAYRDFTSEAGWPAALDPASERLIIMGSYSEAGGSGNASTFNDGYGTFYSADQTGTTNDPKLTVAALNVPGSPTLSISGSLLGVTLGADAFGRAIFKATDNGGGASTSVSAVERSADNATFADITSHCTTHQSGTSWLISDNRPDKGSQAIADGGTAYYRVKLANADGSSSYSSVLSIPLVGLDRPAVEQTYAQAIATYLDTSANANAEADGAYPGVILTALAYAKAAGYAPSSGDYLTVCSTFWSLIKSRGNINADYLHTPATYSGSTGIRRDFHFRLIVHLVIAARILRDEVGGATATSLAADMLDYANRMGKAAFSKLATSTVAGARISSGATGYDAIQAWASGAVVAGEVRKPTGGGGRYCRALNSGTNTTEPTWPAVDNGTVTHQGVTWKDCSAVDATFAQTYNSSGYSATGTYVWDGNQNSEIACALLLLRDEPTTDFAPGGTHDATGYDHAVGEMKNCASYQFTDGGVPVLAGGPADTHYGSFQLHTTAMALHVLGGGVLPTVDLWLDRTLAWFEDNYSTEPTISNAGTTGYATYHRLAEPVWRNAGFAVAGVDDPLDGVYYRSSYVQGTDTIYTEWGYTPENAAYPYAYFFEAVADHLAVIGRISESAGGGGRLLLGVG